MQCLLHLYFSSTILLIRVPTPWETNTLNSSPSLRVIRGVDVHPTPAGVLPQTRVRERIMALLLTKKEDLPGDNDGTSRKSGTLGKERNNLGNRENQVTAHTS